MNEQERIELLKAVAECAPKEARYIEETTQYVVFYVSRDPMKCAALFLDDVGDFSNGQAIIAMLDAMEDAGHCVQEFIRHDCGYDLWLRTGADYILGTGTTRAEAAARAFVKVFGGAK